MRHVQPLILFVVFAVSSHLHAQVVLQLDVGKRGSDTNATLEAGFDLFLIDDEGDVDTAQTNAVTRSYGALSVTVEGGVPGAPVDDRLRTTPTNTTTFTDSLLLTDFIFGRTDGLDISIAGLDTAAVYRTKIWSFDSGSGNNRTSDWYVDGHLVVDNYRFNGAVLPTNNIQSTMDFEALTDTNGVLKIEGRYVGGTISVFVNALALERITGSVPEIIAQPVGATRFAGESVSFVSGAESDLAFATQWFKDGIPLAGQTNQTLSLESVSQIDAGDYVFMAANPVGTASSDTATLVVTPTDLDTALLGYWPLDEVNGLQTPDASGAGNHLTLTNMAATNLTVGWVGSALNFDGTNEFIYADISTNNLSTQMHRSYTVAMWVRGPSGQRDRRVFSQGSTSNTTPLINIGTHNTGANATLDFYLRDNVTTLVNHRHSEQIAFDNTWHHIAIVEENGAGRMYVDGVRDPTSFNYTRSATDFDVMSIGAILRDAPSHWFAGDIDEVYLWARALTSEEIVAVAGALPPRLGVVGVSSLAGDLQLAISTPDTNGLHRIEMKTNVTDAVWTPIPEAVFSVGGTNTLEALIPQSVGERRYYRVGAEF